MVLAAGAGPGHDQPARLRGRHRSAWRSTRRRCRRTCATLLECLRRERGRRLARGSSVEELAQRTTAGSPPDELTPSDRAGSSPIPCSTRYHSEHEMLRYLHRLESRDLSLTTSMIPLGSCTMKLNATSEMLPVTWQSSSPRLHPYAPASDQTEGYRELIADQLETLAGRDHGASPPSRCSPTPDPRASTRASSPSALPPERGAMPSATSASSRSRRTARTPRAPSSRGTCASWPSSATRGGNVDLVDLRAKRCRGARERPRPP